MFPALGFGARLPPNGMVSHEFFLVSEFILDLLSNTYPVLFVFHMCMKVHVCKLFLCFSCSVTYLPNDLSR